MTIGKLCGYYMYFGHVQGGGNLNCFNLYQIEASPSNQGTPFTQGPIIPTVSGQGEDISVSVSSGLVRNTIYSVSIVSINVNGENPSMGDIQFSKSSQSMILLDEYNILRCQCYKHVIKDCK